MANEFVVRRGIISLGGVTFPEVAVTGSYTVTVNYYYIIYAERKDIDKIIVEYKKSI
jgi:hypothetical protein